MILALVSAYRLNPFMPPIARRPGQTCSLPSWGMATQRTDTERRSQPSMVTDTRVAAGPTQPAHSSQGRANQGVPQQDQEKGI